MKNGGQDRSSKGRNDIVKVEALKQVGNPKNMVYFENMKCTKKTALVGKRLNT